MGIPVFDAWARQMVKSMPLTSLKNSIIGIDAAHYLEGQLAPSNKEALLSALGGFPLALESTIMKELNELRTAGFTLHFVFNGLSYGTTDDPFRHSIDSAITNATAFETYDSDLANGAINVFRKSGFPTPANLFEFLKKILHEHDIPFTVAPYSAMAQLAYYEGHADHFVDAVYGPSELFLYGVDKLITKFNLVYKTNEISERNSKKASLFNLEGSSFEWIDRRTCLEQLGREQHGRIPVDVFINACLLAGSNLLPTFPPLNNLALFSKGYSIRDVVNLVVSCGNSITQVCGQYSNDPHMKDVDYSDRYKRALTSIKHHIVITKEGDVETLDKEHAPQDVHDCIGQRLPEELNMYLSRGMLRPRVLNWLTSGKILLDAPYDGGDSVDYRNLVKVQLEPMREQALSLLADSVNRYYQRKEISTRVWFDSLYEAKVNIKDLLPSPKDSISQWNLRGDAIVEQRRKLAASSESLLPGSLSFAIRSLSDADFALRTITPKSKDKDKILKTRHEVTANAVWRFLQLRGYVDKQHRLTSWGEVLQATLSRSGLQKEHEEAAFIAIELLRLNLLNANTMFEDFSGSPIHGSEIDKRNCMLVSRVACLGKIRHQPRGYSGPLSRHLLAYHSLTSMLHASLRDLLEMSLGTMLLEGQVDRNRDDWMDLSLGLPLYDEYSCALGVVVMTYLDELCTRDDPTSEDTREEMKIKGQGWVEHCNFSSSLDDAFHLWDSVYEGVKAARAEVEVKERGMWDEADQWLSRRR